MTKRNDVKNVTGRQKRLMMMNQENARQLWNI